MFEECRIEGDFTLSSGRKSSYFYDFDLLTPREATRYIQRLYEVIPGVLVDEADFIAAPALGGISPGFLIAFAAEKPLVVVDKEGNCRGPEFKQGKYIVIEDVITSFKSVNETRVALEDNECIAVGAYIFRGSNEDLRKQDIDAFYLMRGEREL